MFKKIGTKIMLIGAIPIAMFVLLTVLFILPNSRENIYEQKKSQLINMTDIGLAVLDLYYTKEMDGTLSRIEAQEAAKNAIKNMKYGKNKLDYFWINDFYPKMIMHPFLPELDGEDISNYKDPKGVYLFREMVKVCKAEGAGFVPYEWQYYDEEGRVEPKLSYVVSFKPWQWIIGTGIYINDVNEMVAATRTIIVIIIGGAAAVMFLIILLFSRTISLSLKRVMEHMTKVSEGGPA